MQTFTQRQTKYGSFEQRLHHDPFRINHFITQHSSVIKEMWTPLNVMHSTTINQI